MASDRIINCYGFPCFDNLKHRYINVQNVFTKEECEKIVGLQNKELEESQVNSKEGSNKYDNFRNSEHKWLFYGEDNEWIFDRMGQVVEQFNNQYFKFDLTGFQEPFQFTKYGKDGHYGLHMDAQADAFLPRKLTAVVQLTDPKDYEGGELEIVADGATRDRADKDQGSIFIFPSFLLHEVMPVIKGERFTLVAWANGPSFR